MPAPARSTASVSRRFGLVEHAEEVFDAGRPDELLAHALAPDDARDAAERLHVAARVGLGTDEQETEPDRLPVERVVLNASTFGQPLYAEMGYVVTNEPMMRMRL